MWLLNKKLAKYPFDEKDGKKDICSMNDCSEKNAILNFFSKHNLAALHTKFHTVQTPLHVFWI